MEPNTYPKDEATRYVVEIFSETTKSIIEFTKTARGKAALTSFIYEAQTEFRDRLDRVCLAPFQMASDWECTESSRESKNPVVIDEIKKQIQKWPWYDRALGLVLSEAGLREKVPAGADCPYGTLMMGCLSDSMLGLLRQAGELAQIEYSQDRAIAECGQNASEPLFVTRERVAEVRSLEDSTFSKRIARSGEVWPPTTKLQPGQSKRKRVGWFLNEIEGHPLLPLEMVAKLRQNPGYKP